MKRSSSRFRFSWLSTPSARRILALVAMVIALLTLYRRLVAGRVLAGGDLHLYFFPYWVAVSKAFQAGKLPSWNPYLFAGAPLLANSQAGVFYPLNWPLWLLSGPSLAGVARMLHGSVLLHVLLAALNTVVLAWRLGLGPWSAALAGFLYAGSGYLGVHVEHLNQLQGLAWMPLVWLPPSREMRHTGEVVQGSQHPQRIAKIPWPSAVNVLALALVVLAGHTQTAFITVVGLLIWRGLPFFIFRWRCRERRLHLSVSKIAVNAWHFGLSLLPFGIAGLIAAVQLLPTFELSRFSVRAGGLPWREAVSFSIAPWDLPWALLPPYVHPPCLPEGVAYLGIVALGLVGGGVIGAWRTREPRALALVVLSVSGIFLSLGGYNPLYLAAVRLGVPGLIHFRAPARFMALFVLSASLLAGLAFNKLHEIMRGRLGKSVGTLLAGGLLLWIVIDLLVASEYLPHAHATASRAYTDLRPATAHLVAATQADEGRGQPPDRFLSISKMLFDPGDKVEIETIYGAFLSPDALWAYWVAAKAREVLSPNLSLAFGVPAVDGYDGGLLPMAHYVRFSKLLLPGGTLDGRLRENLVTVPDTRWLSLLGVRFLIMDKTGDAWSDGVFYDRQFQPALAFGETLEIGWLPEDFDANALGVLYQGAGEATVTLKGGEVLSFSLGLVASTSASSEGDNAQEGGIRLRWPEPTPPSRITLRATSRLTLTGASLIDERTGAFYPLVLSDHFRLVHSGDVKIYENLPGHHALPRAFWVQHCVSAPSADALLALMKTDAFDPTTQVALLDSSMSSVSGTPFVSSTECVPIHDGLGRDPDTQGSVAPEAQVKIVTYEEDHVIIEVHAESSGFVVLTDAWYPGWQCDVISLEPTSIKSSLSTIPLQADLLFRAVPLPAGDWRITYTYTPRLIFYGLGGTLLGLLLALAYVAFVRDRA